jgi:hypothetical protein
LVGAVVIAWAVFSVSVAALFDRALSTRRSGQGVNERAHWLAEERAYARVGIVLLAIGVALQLLAAAATGLHGTAEILLGIVAIAAPVLVAMVSIRLFVPRWIQEVDDARVKTAPGARS